MYIRFISKLLNKTKCNIHIEYGQKSASPNRITEPSAVVQADKSACKILICERIFKIQTAAESLEWDQHKWTIKDNLQNELGVFVAACHD